MSKYDWSACIATLCAVNVPSPTVNNTYTYVDIDIESPHTSLLLTVLDIDQGASGGINECILPSRNNAEEAVGVEVSSNVEGTFCALKPGHYHDNPKGIPWAEDDAERSVGIPIYSQIHVRFLTYCCNTEDDSFVPSSSDWLDTMTYVDPDDDASQLDGGRNFFLAFAVTQPPVRAPIFPPLVGPPTPFYPPRPPISSPPPSAPPRPREGFYG